MGKPNYEANPYVRKHIHRWVLTEKKPAVSAGYRDFWLGGEWVDAAPMKLTRECDDCGRCEMAEVPDESVLVPGYEAISGDLMWKEVV